MLTLRKAAAETAVAVRLHGAASLSLPLPWAEPVLAIVVWLTDGEFGIGSGWRSLAFDAWQRRTYQPPVYWPFIRRFRRGVFFPNVHGAVAVLGGIVRIERDRDVRFTFAVVRHRRRCGLLGKHGLGSLVVQLWSAEALRGQRSGRFRLSADARHLRRFVFVIRVAGGATRLLDVVADHGDHHVVRHAPLARAIVVQNFTKPRLALLHQSSRTEPK